MASARKPTAFEPAATFGMDRLSSEIFSILESNFLFGTTTTASSPDVSSSPTASFLKSPAIPSLGKVRVLSVDAAGATEGLLAAASLVRLETALRLSTGDPSARIADFFDIAAGSGVGGVLVALLFSAGKNGLPLLSAHEAMHFLSKHHAAINGTAGKKGGIFRSLFKGRSGSTPNSSAKVFKEVFGDLTLRDTLKPVLIPCYDLCTGAPFVFSRADAVEMDGTYDFNMWEVCTATMGTAAKVASMDGRTVISAAAVDGGVAMRNPAAMAVTHVLNNKMEFPMACGVQDLVLVSLGNGEGSGYAGGRPGGSATPGPARIARIAGDGVSDIIDQAVAMSFGTSRSSSYVRVNGHNPKPRTSSSSSSNPVDLCSIAEEMLLQPNVESVLFRGKKLSEQTNADRLDWVAGELVKEADCRRRCSVPIVAVSKRGDRRCSTSSYSSSLMSSSPSATSLSSSP